MAMRYRWLPVLIVVCCTSACLRQETGHTLYLSPHGAVQWTALERDVRSDENDVTKRAAEERQFLQAAMGGAHPIAMALSALSPLDVRTQIVRGDRPFTVVTEARFARIDALATRILAEFQLPGKASLTHATDRTTLSIHFVIPDDEDGGPAIETPITALLEDLDHVRIVLTDGTFVAAEGFELQEDGTVALPAPPDAGKIAAQRGRIDLSLTWKSR